MIVARSLLLSLALAGPLAQADALQGLIETIVDKRLPQTLYEGKAIAWEYGFYDLTISKAGSAKIVSAEKHIEASMPLHITLKGDIKKKLFGSEIEISCSSEFSTNSKMALEPVWADSLQAKLNFDLPIPPTEMDCQGLRLPIQVPLQQLIAQEKPDWEKQA
ncbi:MAG: DUF4403 family protein, partial [Cellvibrionaceae bacterium]|nr:DUF4403 family protein [Cellvibrionaceae bacterium]